MFTLGAYAIIFDARKRVLLCHRRDIDAWNLPGGAVELGELPSEAVIRETKEETGLDVEVLRLVGVYGKPDNERELVFAFECKIIGGQISTTPESDQIQYFAAGSLPKNTLPRHIGRIEDALKGAQPVFRRQSEPSFRDLIKDVMK